MRAAVFHHSVHLNEQQLREAEAGCPFCGSHLRTEFTVLQDHPTVSLLRCDNCQACSASRMPTDDALDDFYRHYYSDGVESVTFDRPERLSTHIANRVMHEWDGLHGRHISVVDYGGGDGTISLGVAEALVAHGASSVEIKLIDHCHMMVVPKSDKVVLHMCEFDDLRAQSADIVLASAVLEHLTRPREVMARLFDVMKVGAVFYARTPYMVPLMRLANYAGRKIDFTFPGHLHDMGRHFWDGVGNHFAVKLKTISSTTSIAESAFDKNFLRALIARLMKMPSKLFRNHYNLVGGWEVFLKRIS